MKKLWTFLTKSALVIILFFLSINIVNSQKIDETAKLLPVDGVAGDFFGSAVATNGEIAVVGAWFKNNFAGAVYVFRRYGSTWTEEEKLIPSDGSSYDFFGNSVDVYEDYIIVGATGSGNIGAAYIFKHNGNSWEEVKKLTPDNGIVYDRYGSSVAISEEYAIVGAESAQTLKGAVYVYSKDGSSWTEDDMLTGALYSSGFGSAVDISGESIIIGASDNSYAFVFMLDGNTWVMTAELDDLNGSIYDQFGASVSIDGDLAVVGATHHQNGNGATGAVYVYKRQGSNWVEEEKIVADDGELDDHFGVVSMFGNTIIVGAYSDDDYGLDAGSAYLYQKEGNNWEFKEKLFASDGFAGDEFGSAAAVFSDVIVLGAPDDNDNGENSGSAYIFNYNPQTGIPFITDNPAGTLEQNYPNPFHHVTSINYYIEKSGFVQIEIFNVKGVLIKTVVSEIQVSGGHTINWDGTNQNGIQENPGLYLYRFITDSQTFFKTMLKI